MNAEKTKKLIKELRTLAKQDTRLNTNELRIILALERAIARLQSEKILAKHLIFKGGFVLLKQYDSQRFTRDADALAVDISKEQLGRLVTNALDHDLDDGLWYGDIEMRSLEEQGQYGALRFDAAFQIGEPKPNKIHKLSRIHIDIGFSDKVIAKVATKEMPQLLGVNEPISWQVYPVEQIVAEKLETLFRRNIENSRAKDVYDLNYLIPKCTNRKLLRTAIEKTFDNRKTPIPESLFEAAKGFEDLTILNVAWPGVKTMEKKPSFGAAWEQLLGYLKELDQLCA